MIAARLKQCLETLRWRAADFAEASGYDLLQVEAWLNGRARPPLVVSAWLEALVKAHLSVPPLGETKSAARGSAAHGQHGIARSPLNLVA